MIIKIDPKHVAEKLLEKEKLIKLAGMSELILFILEQEYDLVSFIETEFDALNNPGPTNAAEDKERRGDF